jgi:putative membrane protein
MTLVWVALLAAIVWALASLFGRGEVTRHEPSPRADEILDCRFARGEIDVETYDRLRANLRAGRGERV